MGVKGLSRFLSTSGCFDTISLDEYNAIIIDGNALRYALLKPNINSFFGGDYWKYESAIRGWLDNILSYVNSILLIMDGCGEKIKSEESYSRRINRVLRSIFSGPNASMPNAPILGLFVFMEVVCSYPKEKIILLQTDYEADYLIAEIAHQFKIPVVSADSDFYIYDVDFIPLTSINVGSSCERFNREAFIHKFNLPNKDFLYLLATIIGNDYVAPSLLSTFYSQIHFPTKKKGMCKIPALLKWLSNEKQIDSAINGILEKYPYKERSFMKKKFEGSLAMYAKKTLTNDQCLDQVIASYVASDKRITNPEGVPAPEFFMRAFRRGEISPFIGNIFANRLLYQILPTEDASEECSVIFCLPIFKEIVNLASFDGCNPEKRVKVFYREGKLLKSIHIEVEQPYNFATSWSVEEKKTFILKVVDITCSQIEALKKSIPEQYHLLYYSLHFFASYRSKNANLYIKALIISLLLWHPKALGYSGPCVLNSNIVDKLNVFGKRSLNCSNDERKVVHELNLMQCSHSAVISLNMALLNPYKDTASPTDLWHGMFLYNISKDIAKYRDQDKRIKAVLSFSGDSSAFSTFQSVLKMLQPILPNVSEKIQNATEGRRSSKKKRQFCKH